MSPRSNMEHMWEWKYSDFQQLDGVLVSGFDCLSVEERRRLLFLLVREDKYLCKLRPPAIYCENKRCRGLDYQRTIIAHPIRDRYRRTPETGFELPPIDTVSVLGPVLLVRKDDPSDHVIGVARQAQLEKPKGTWYSLPVRIMCHKCSHITSIDEVVPEWDPPWFPRELDRELAALMMKNDVLMKARKTDSEPTSSST